VIDAKFKASHAEALLADDIDFKSLIGQKVGRNQRKSLLTGIGIGKLNDLMKEKVMNGRELLQYNNLSYKFKPEVIAGWKRKVKAIFKDRRMAIMHASYQRHELRVSSERNFSTESRYKRRRCVDCQERFCEWTSTTR
jgi:hypothetical protein